MKEGQLCFSLPPHERRQNKNKKVDPPKHPANTKTEENSGPPPASNFENHSLQKKRKYDHEKRFPPEIEEQDLSGLDHKYPLQPHQNKSSHTDLARRSRR